MLGGKRVSSSIRRSRIIWLDIEYARAVGIEITQGDRGGVGL